MDALLEWMPYISMVGTITAMYFSFRNGRKTDMSEVEVRAAENAKINVKLDDIVRRITEINEEFRSQRHEIQMLLERMAKVEASSKQAHRRLDHLERDATREEE